MSAGSTRWPEPPHGSGYQLAFAIAGYLVLAAVVLTPILLRRNDGATPAAEAELAAKLGAIEAAYAQD